ncbi:MAG: ketoacyl-ACP synthase III [Bacteroidales bacterium]|nr:ketoacyl-ACP synthase III [Bacteroidales bacterium]MDD3201020.1 ketoacyl-ACP synthase III [Bacteroidales bacterium]
MNIIGTGCAHPSLTVTNEMLSGFLDTSDEWITTRTGIKKRQLISDERLEDLATEAATKALENAGVAAEDLDYIICSNVINEYITPSLSCILQGKIGANSPCVDLNGACAGFIYALDIANSFFKSKDIKNILIVCAEEPTRMVDWNQRNTCVLFGDGAGAVVLSRGEDVMAIKLTAVSKPEPLYQMRKLEHTPFINKEEPDGPLVMKGQDVFKLAVESSKNDINSVIDECDLSYNDVNYYLLHQANIRIIDTIRNTLQQDESKFPHNIEKYGNTSSASIPILLDELNRDKKLKKGDKLVLSAFGAGFVAGACLLKWSKE